MTLENLNPKVYGKAVERKTSASELDDDVVDEIDSREVFGILFIAHAISKWNGKWPKRPMLGPWPSPSPRLGA